MNSSSSHVHKNPCTTTTTTAAAAAAAVAFAESIATANQSEKHYVNDFVVNGRLKPIAENYSQRIQCVLNVASIVHRFI